MQFAIIAFTLLYGSYIISNLLGVHFAFKPFHLRHVLVVKATFTSSAYQRNSWYDNPKVKTIHVVTDESQYDRRMKHGGSWWTFNVLSRYVDYTDDIAVSKNPRILDSYDKIIMLHNEYVTTSEFNAIMQHQNVFYTFPNAMYRFVSYNETANTITRIGQTDDPYSEAKWEKADEFDRCYVGGYQVIDYPNGKGLSCYAAYQSIWNPLLPITILAN